MKLKDRRSKKELIREVDQLRGVIRLVAARLGFTGKFNLGELMKRAEDVGPALSRFSPSAAESAPAESAPAAGRAESAPTAAPVATEKEG